MERLKGDILWVELIYTDSSVKVFRGTQCKEFIKSIENGSMVKYDSICESENINDYIYDVRNRVFIYLGNMININLYSSKPIIERRVDRFGNCFI